MPSFEGGLRDGHINSYLLLYGLFVEVRRLWLKVPPRDCRELGDPLVAVLVELEQPLGHLHVEQVAIPQPLVPCLAFFGVPLPRLCNLFYRCQQLKPSEENRRYRPLSDEISLCVDYFV